MKMEVCNTQGTVYNPVRRSFIRPKESEYFCPVCKGTGEITGDRAVVRRCTKCLGKGTLDWISRIIEHG
jgi:DnaJ-class molecular chaperone